MRKKFLIILCLITFFYCFEALFINIKFTYEIPSVHNLEEESEDTNERIDSKQEIKPEVTFIKGVYFKVSKLTDITFYLKDDDIPTDGQLEKTIDKLERAILSTKISAFLWFFIGLLSISSLIAIWMDTWFAPFTARFLFFFSVLISLQNLTASVPHLIHIPLFGFFSFLFHFIITIFMIWGFRTLGSNTDFENMKFYNLYIASQNNEESNTGKVLLPEKKINEPKFNNRLLNWIVSSIPVKIFLFIFTNQIVRHFILIILTGILIGNIIYIPLFSLQKHYSSQFGFLLFMSIILLSLLYLRNYYSFIKEEKDVKSFEGTLVSIAFLQYRFLRNIFYFLVSTTGIIIFFVAIFLLLTLNTVLLKNYQLIDKTLNL